MNTSHFFNIRKSSGTSRRLGSTGYGHQAEEAVRSVGLGEYEEDGPVSGDSRITSTQMAITRESMGFDSETLTSVTIRQVHNAIFLSSEPVKINNKVVKYITVIGRVVKLDAEATKITIVLDDCTSMIEAVHLTSPDGDMSSNSYSSHKCKRIEEGLWVRVIGIPCLMDGETKISIIRMRSVDDSNEMMFHRLDVVKTFLSELGKTTVL